MAKITWTIETAAGTVEESGSNVSEANMDRFIEWAWNIFPQFDAVEDPETFQMVPTPAARTPANEARAVRAWAQKEWEYVKSNVITWEFATAEQAAKKAIVAPDPIE